MAFAFTPVSRPSATPRRRHILPVVAAPFARLAATLQFRRHRARLAALDDHLLRDIGISRAEAETESARPVWNAPSHWFR
jgi:uncharacterized protein YjiS (DUF1127 family)